MQRFFVLLITIYAFATTYVIADQRSETLRQIELAKKEVSELKTALNKLRVQQSSVQKQLKQTETEIANLMAKINAIKTEQTTLEAELVQLNKDKQNINYKLKEQEHVIGIQAKATYESGHQEYIKLLLNQQDPEKISRTMVYYDYLSQARLEQLAVFKETIQQLQQIEDDIAKTKLNLTNQDAELQAQRAILAEARKKRMQILAILNKQINDKNNRVSQRERDQLELNKVLRTIDETVTRQAKERAALTASNTKPTTKPTTNTTNQNTFVTTTGDSSGTFANAKGKLPWPVNGRIINHFGTARDNGHTKWDGTLISVARGTKVKAVHAGRVVYADWLRGVGLLIIIDHGQGYYSLYGHNQSLLKRVGDNIRAGDAISEVGSSGGLDRPALYFSIRQQGRAVNPASWCKI